LPQVEFSLAPDHPAAEGHFPGNPIIPGALLLSEALRAIGAELGAPVVPCRVRLAKFTRPVRPGEIIAVEFSREATGGMRFRCMVRGTTVLIGEVECIALAST